MALSVDTRPEKTVNGVLSRWNAANLPLIYKLANTKFPTNSDDATINFTAVTDDNGYAKLDMASGPSVAKDWVEVTGGSVYDGIHQIISIDGNDFTIDTPFISDDTGTTQHYYQNYTTLIRVYAGIAPDHLYTADKPMALIGTIEQVPGSDNLTVVDVREYVKQKLSTVYNESLDSWENDINAWCDFYVSFAERYDSVSSGSVIDFTSEYTLDLEDGTPIYCKGVHGALQFGYEYGGNMGEYLVNNEFYSDIAKWMTDFERPKIIDYNKYNISILIDVFAYDLFPEMHFEEFDQNGTSLGTTVDYLIDQDYGLYRIPVNIVFQSTTKYVEATLMLGDIEMTETISIDVDVACNVANLLDVSDVTKTAHWYDANSVDWKTKAVQNWTTPIGGGGRAGSWIDRINEKDLVQTLVGNAPIRSTNTITFDGAAEWMEINERLIDAYPFTMFAVIKTTDTSGGILDIADQSATIVNYQIRLSGGDAVNLARNGAANQTATSTTPVNDDIYHIVTGEFISATNRKIWVDGVDEDSNTNSVTFNSAVDRISVGRLGDSTPGDYYGGEIAEQILDSVQYELQERQQIEGYLAWKWGIQDQLPEDHPYRNQYPLV